MTDDSRGVAWAALTRETLVEKGIDPEVAGLAESYTVVRSLVEEKIGAALSVIDESEGVIADERQKISVARDQIIEVQDQLRTTYAASGGVLGRLVVGYESSTPVEIVERARLATTVKRFNERLIRSSLQPVIHAIGGCNATYFVLKGARGEGQPLSVEPKEVNGRTDNFFVVPSDGHGKITMPVSPQATMTYVHSPEPLAQFPPGYRNSRFYFDVETVRGLAGPGNRDVMRQFDLWVVGEDTIKELAKILAVKGENHLNPWNFKRTRLDAVVHDELLALRRMTINLGIDIEEVPEVRERFVDWRRLADKWAVGDTSDEVDETAVAELMDLGFRAGSREPLIRFLNDELAA